MYSSGNTATQSKYTNIIFCERLSAQKNASRDVDDNFSLINQIICNYLEDLKQNVVCY